MAIPRSELIDQSKPGTYHINTRCVRRAFLCGWDSYSGNDYEHRRAWIRERMIFLADVFAIDLLAYSVMMNHLHQVLRNRPWRSSTARTGWPDIRPTAPSSTKLRTAERSREPLRRAPGLWTIHLVHKAVNSKCSRQLSNHGLSWPFSAKSGNYGDGRLSFNGCEAIVVLQPLARTADSELLLPVA